MTSKSAIALRMSCHRGSYSELRNAPADRVVKVPSGVSDQQAAALMLKGMTAQYLLRRTYRVKRGDIILAHAAVGGVGLILCQWAKSLGATVIGVVGSEAKAEIARKHGCKHVLISGRDELVPSVKKNHQERGRRRCLRRCGQGHLHGVARLPAAARDDGVVRQRIRAASCPQSAGAE